MRPIAFLALGALLAAHPAAAGEGCSSSAAAKVQHIFEQADGDQNGGLNRAEYEGAGLQSFGVSFEQTDTDGSGETSLDEYIDLYQRTHPPTDRTDA